MITYEFEVRNWEIGYVTVEAETESAAYRLAMQVQEDGGVDYEPWEQTIERIS